ncbi:MAG TPA: DNA-processing protein DprA [Usitatibacter sp.]|nr:DNA-processing protein DprA [Usitatibacter sp.]
MAFDIETVAASSTESWLRFTLVPLVPAHKQRDLLRRWGSPDAALGAPHAELAQMVGEDAARARARGPELRILEATREWLARPGCRLVGLGDPEYPAAWKQIACPPSAFYAQGRAELLNRPCLAIVGSRNATPQGERDAHAFARTLSEHGVVIASGLALGIDASAHRGGLAGAGSTVAITGTGPDIVYPRGNAGLAREIAERGCIVSEFPARTPPLERNFPRRNRLISGLARGVLVVEAAYPSGSLGTAHAALEQNRDVFAMPGSIHSPVSKGCHWLIKEGAKLVDCVEDILHEMGIVQPRDREAAPANEDKVLAAMGFAPATMDQIEERTGLDAATLAARLSWLEIEGRVRAIAGGWFQRAENRVIE